jgi:hypothetical protein
VEVAHQAADDDSDLIDREVRFGLNRQRKKGPNSSKTVERALAGAKAPIDFATFAARLNRLRKNAPKHRTLHVL